MKVIVARSGFLTSVQDVGRTGFREFGVSAGGALDPFALRVANLLVGNDEAAAGLEITFGGLQLHFQEERIVAWCGGEFDVRVGSTALPVGHAALVPAGDELKFGRSEIGCRAWLTISGGINVSVVAPPISEPVLEDSTVVRCEMATFFRLFRSRGQRLQLRASPRGLRRTIG